MGNHRTRRCRDDPDTEHPIGLCVGNDLHKTVGILDRLGATIPHHREFADLDLAARAGVLLGQADTGNLGVRIDHRWNDIMVHHAGQPRNILRNRNTLILGLVRQHRAGNDIANRPDAAHARSEIMSRLYLATRVDRQTCLVEAKSVDVGPTADGDQHHIGLNGLRCTTCRWLDRDGRTGTLALNAGDLG